jgi:uncharacterized protein YcbK (DUF882 family)
MKLTKNFKLSEFKCKCGCKMPDDVLDNIKLLANDLQTIRDYVLKPIHPTNAYRCKKHNKEVGGVKNSQHLYGKAADLQCSITPNDLADIIEELIEKGKISEGGLGRYSTFTHYDRRGTKARW